MAGGLLVLGCVAPASAMRLLAAWHAAQCYCLHHNMEQLAACAPAVYSVGLDTATRCVVPSLAQILRHTNLGQTHLL